VPEITRPVLTFSDFWASRYGKHSPLIDRLATLKISCLVAYGCYRLGAPPSALTIGALIVALAAFAAALLLPVERVAMSIVVLYVVGQLSYVLDRADGQLIRATASTSRFDDFLGKGLDICSAVFAFGGFFAYVFRVNVALGDLQSANTVLMVGFFFFLARASRFLVWQNFMNMYRNAAAADPRKDSALVRLLKNFMDHQFSLFSMLVFPLYSGMTYVIFAAQSVIMIVVYFRYFVRAYHLDES